MSVCAQVEVGGGEVGGEQQPHVLEVGRGLLAPTPARLRPCSRTRPDEVGLVADASSADDEVVLHRREVRRRVVGERPVRGDALARCARAVSADLRQQPRRWPRRATRARLREPRARGGERRAVARAPAAASASSCGSPKRCHQRPFRRGVVRRAFAPRRLDLPGQPASRAPACCVAAARAAHAGRASSAGTTAMHRAAVTARLSACRVVLRCAARPHLVAVGQRIGRVEHQPVGRGDAVEHLDRLAVVAAELHRRAAARCPSASTTATRVPSPRNSSALVGIDERAGSPAAAARPARRRRAAARRRWFGSVISTCIVRVGGVDRRRRCARPRP